MSDPAKPLRSGDQVKTADGNTATLPYADEHPCIGNRNGWCTNAATWRRDTSHTMLHFCETCKQKPEINGPGVTWTKMDPRPSDKPAEPKIVTWTPAMFKRFKKEYAKHEDDREKTFEFDGNTYLVGYAKYLIEYLEPRIKE